MDPLRLDPSTDQAAIRLLRPPEKAQLLETSQSGGYWNVRVRDDVGWVWGSNVVVVPEYDRDDWRHWTDEDGDCQNKRQEVLIRDSEIPVTFEDANQCRVESGRWTCPYTGEVFIDPGDLDVDHVVPLGNANFAGGWAWDSDRKRAYANDLEDPRHLLAVKPSENRRKGSDHPADYVPQLNTFHCEYTSVWQGIKTRWGLETTSRTGPRWRRCARVAHRSTPILSDHHFQARKVAR